MFLDVAGPDASNHHSMNDLAQQQSSSRPNGSPTADHDANDA
jgi:hypothetical protein